MPNDEEALTACWRDICETIRTSPHAERIIEQISDTIGPRPTGSDGMRQARAYVARELEEIGVAEIHEEAVPVFAWERGHERLTLTAPYAKHFETIQHVHTASGQGEALLVDVDSASDAELDEVGSDLQGAVALISGPPLGPLGFPPRTECIAAIALRGAAAAVV